MIRTLVLFLAVSLVPTFAAEKIRALIVDGQNNHRWQVTTPILKKLLEETNLITVDVATTPPKGGDFSSFHPEWSKYKVVISNYNGEDWPTATLKSLTDFVLQGGGFVSYHAADNAFPGSQEFNMMIGLGGWGNRNEASGPYLRWKDGKMVRDPSPGRGGSHGAQHQYQMITRDSNHPIMKGIPEKWMHNTDELYDRLRGPGNHLTLLATAYSEPSTRGSGEHEPLLMTIKYGKGRVFHTALGHDVPALSCVGFITTFNRGTEWAATGKVTQKLPPDFPTASEVKTRKVE